jgi:SAM-dependent methyltransferase
MKTPVLYPLTVLLGAFLLFQVQPLIGKYFLPWFGGVPTVWTACVLGFQVLLLLGYGYAHLLVGRLKGRRQAIVHGALLVLSLIVMALLLSVWEAPILPGQAWKPDGTGSPVVRLLLLVTVSIGVPFILLSTTSPLLQAWFSLSHPGRSPYLLYALSNAGSLVALLTYPVMVEPWLPLRTQALLWSGGYVVYAAGCGLCALRAYQALGEGAVAAPSREVEEPARLTRVRGLLWLGLPAASCVMLLATTHLICQEIAVIPFLWILPLSLYLLSFILCFAGERVYRRGFYWVAFVLALVAACWLLGKGPGLSIWSQTLGFSAVLFFCCMLCHGELFRLRPVPSRLTLFYGLVALGGAVGGILVALVAPLVFDGPWEYHAGLFLCAALAVSVLASDPTSRFRRFPAVRLPLLALLVVLEAVLGKTVSDSKRTALYTARSFYGTLQVKDTDAPGPNHRLLKLYNGATLHGTQFDAAVRRREPVAYYGRTSGIAYAFQGLREWAGPTPLHVGVIGLGVGTLAAYGREDDTFRFYEINPDVVALAKGEGGFFSYLQDSAATVRIVMGDARLSLEREVRQAEVPKLDLLVVDAFSGDSIPVHLLTREAVELYLKRLRPGGVLAFHISNRYFNLWPVTARLVRSLNLQAVLIHAVKDNERGDSTSFWVLATEDAALLAQPVISTAATNVAVAASAPLWTDQLSDLFRALR